MSGSDVDETAASRPAEAAGQPPLQQPSPSQSAPPTTANHVSSALRSAYEETVKEAVPSEFLDLLGKLS